MTRSEYLAMPALNFSSARHLLRSPAHYKAALEEPEDELKYVVGKLAHAMVLEQKDLRDLYAIKPRGLNLATKEGKAWKAEQTLPILKEEDANRVPRMAEAIANHDEAAKALRNSPQREVILQGGYYGVPIKGIVDAMGCNVIEVKTCMDSSDDAFAFHVNDLDYDAQAVWYMELSKKRVAWIAVENHAPYTVNFIYPSALMEASGRDKMDMMIRKYNICARSGDWSAYACGDYTKELHEIDPPYSRLKQLETAGML